jgi:glycolate oxidase
MGLARLRELTARNEDLVVVAGAGVTTGAIQTAAESRALFYPPDPSSSSVSTIGGNIATNAGGPHGFKYGVTRDYLLGLEIVLADGTIVHTGGATLKNATGYNLTQLLCGSEGTLAVITRAVLRLIPRPEARAGVSAAFDCTDDAAHTVLDISGAGIIPAALELMDRTALEGAAPDEWPQPPAGLLLVEVDGPLETVGRQASAVAEICRRRGAHDVRTVTGADMAGFYSLRRSVSGALVNLYPVKIGEDVVVPVSMVPGLIRDIAEIGASTGVKIAVFGHAGDGNLHPNILFDPRETDAGRVEAAMAAVFKAALKCGGTVSGEHGIGSLKAPYFQEAVGPEAVKIMRGIKRVFDPHGLLNPGKIWTVNGE